MSLRCRLVGRSLIDVILYACTAHTTSVGKAKGRRSLPPGGGGGEASPQGGEAPPPGGGEAKPPPRRGDPPQGGVAPPPPKNGKKCTPPPNLFHTPPKKNFLPPQKNQKNFYLIKKQNRGKGGWGRFFKSKFASDASFLRYLQKTKNLIFLHIRFRETL